MKEATGELNLTVIVVIAVGVLMAFFFTILWPMLKTNFNKEANCKSAVCQCSQEMRDNNNGRCCCWTKGDRPTGNTCDGEGYFTCPFGG